MSETTYIHEMQSSYIYLDNFLSRVKDMSPIAPDKRGYPCIFVFCTKTYFVGTPHSECLAKVLLTSTHNKCFCAEIRKNIGLFGRKKHLIWSYEMTLDHLFARL